MKIDIVEFIKTSGKIVNEDSPDPNKELVTLVNFTGTVSWTKRDSSQAEAGIEQDNEVVFVKDVKPPFPLQPTIPDGGAGGMKTGIGAMEK
jgi:hypothetical protein